MSISNMQGAVVLITGGTGTFGHAFLDRCLEAGAQEVRIFSRDEKKQYDMEQEYRKHGNVKFFLGDIRDKATIALTLSGVDYVFHAAAMKQVPSCERFPMEAVKTNINGSDNLLSTALQKRVKKIVMLSTDKAVYPTSAMGMTKAYMEKLAIQKAMDSAKTEICITRFGNLVASRGSAVPLFIEQAKNNNPITITDPNMTRYLMTVDQAVDLVEKAFYIGHNGDLLVKNARACTTGDLANAVCKYLSLPDDYPKKVIGARPGEKMHEWLLSEEETEKAFPHGDFVVVPMQGFKNGLMDQPLRSDLAERMTEDQVLELIRSVFEGGVS